MYCVKFGDPLRGKFGVFKATTDYADGADENRGLQTTNEHEFTRIKAEAIYKKLVFIGVYSWLMQKAVTLVKRDG